MSVCTGAPRLGLSAPSSTLSAPHRAAAYAPFILTHTHTDGYQVGTDARTHTQQGDPTVPPSLPVAVR